MAGIQDFIVYEDDFIGPSVSFPTSADPATPWLAVDTSSAGTPTYVRATSEAVLTLASNTEVENVCLAHGDALSFDADGIQSIEFRAKVTATLDSATTIVMGLGSARNDTPDSVAANVWFRLEGSNSLVCETDDGTTDLDDKATGVSLSSTYKKFYIDLSNRSDVKFYVDGQRVAGSTTFDFDKYSSGLQPIFQIQKTSDNNTDALTIDYVRIVCKRV